MKFGHLHPYVFEQMRKKTKFHPNRQKRKKTRKSSEWRHIHTVDYPKNQLLKNFEFWFLGRMREILEVYR